MTRSDPEPRSQHDGRHVDPRDRKLQSAFGRETIFVQAVRSGCRMLLNEVDSNTLSALAEG